jgi:NitT/TauT family transport system permease protein
MTFSFYQSLKSVPADLEEAARSFHLSGWLRFWRLDVPFSMPGLVWNTMMSMSGGWFFVVASEAITVGNTTVTLPGIGAYVALAIKQQDLRAVGYAVSSMLLVIILYDQLLFRPIVAWADKFRFEQTPSAAAPTSWVLDLFRRARALRAVTRACRTGISALAGIRVPLPRLPMLPHRVGPPSRVIDALWLLVVLGGAVCAGWKVVEYVGATLSWADVGTATRLGFVTLVRVVVLMALASLVWVPIGVWIGLRPKVAEKVQPLAQFLAAFPANIAFPVVVVAIVRYGLDANVWLSPLMILGTQWYILFNVIAGTSALPTELRLAASNLGVRRWLWWRRVMLPAIFPAYVTGAVTASGGSWNASIVSEVVQWGDTTLHATGIGAYIAQYTAAGDPARIALGIGVLCLYVLVFNRLLWHRLYEMAAERLRLD